MTFVTACADRGQLAMLSHLLVNLFPGCTVHQSSDPVRAIQRLSCQKIDAVFADADSISNMVDLLDRRKLNTQIWLLCHCPEAIPEKIAGRYGVLAYPITEQKLRIALQKTK